MTASRDRGAVTLFTVVVVGALFIVGGLVVDGGRLLATARSARSTASEAARAGAQEVVREGNATALDPVAADARAEAFLAAVGASGHAEVLCPTVCDRVRVTVVDTAPMTFLAAAGVGPRQVSRTVTVRIAAGRVVEGG